MVAEETSYIDSNASEADDMVNNATPKKTQTRTYVLGPLPKTPSFRNLSDDNTELVLPKSKFVGSNQLLSAKSCVPDRHSFKPIRSFTLNVELAAVLGKTNGNKLISIKKIFYKINGFGRASTPSKFPGIIKSLFISEFSMNKVKELAIREKTVVNNDLKKVSSCSDKKIVVKKILVDLPKLAVKSVFSKFRKIVSIKIQLIGLWQKALVEFEFFEIADLVTAKWSVFMGKNFVYVAKAIDDKQSWVSRDLHQALLYTFLVGIMAYDLSNLLESYGKKTCFIGRNLSSYVHDRCAIVCFVDETSKLTAIGSAPVFKSVNLCWASFFLAHCV
ncbi:hypothetical protein G9A89_023857 [Geosiphon pyriformis]|nr:hypothetical protein G9A89_023857 [Geosiphon pyriformis]